MRILMVCLGNICRSPLAEGILKSKIESLNLDWRVDSAGTGAWHVGEKPDPRSAQIAKQNGIQINDQRARQFRSTDFEEFDLIFTMDQSNHRDVLAKTQNGSDQQKVEMILNIPFPGKNLSVPDPYWNDNGFEQVFQLLDQACNAIIEKYHQP